MGRRKKKENRDIAPDPRYNNLIVAKFINHLMTRGKKSIAQKIIYDAFEIIKKETKKDPISVFDEALKNVMPILEVKSKRIGGATYQVPIEVRGDRRMTLAMRWIIEAARSQKGKPISKKLARDLIDASKGTGAAIKKRHDIQRMAEANRAFAHFAR